MSNPVPTNLWNEGYHVGTDIEIRKSIGHYPSGQQLVTPRFLNDVNAVPTCQELDQPIGLCKFRCCIYTLCEL